MEIGSRKKLFHPIAGDVVYAIKRDITGKPLYALEAAFVSQNYGFMTLAPIESSVALAEILQEQAYKTRLQSHGSLMVFPADDVYATEEEARLEM